MNHFITQDEKVSLILTEVVEWAAYLGNISAVALVGSWARGTAGPSSDIDLMILTPDPSSFRHSDAWLDRVDWRKIGSGVKDWRDVDYGLAWSRHVCLEDRTEIEFCFGFLSWASFNPIDVGTFKVVSDGCRILYDRDYLMTNLLAEINCKYSK